MHLSRTLLGVAVLAAASVVAVVVPPVSPASATLMPAEPVTYRAPTLPTAPDSGNAIAIRQDGTRVVAGGAGGNFGLWGSLVFGSGAGLVFDGGLIADFDGRDDVANALVVTGANGLVAAGSSSGDIALLRLDDQGYPVPGFGPGVSGRVLTDLGGADDAAYGIALRPGGGFLVAGGNGSTASLLFYGDDGYVDARVGGEAAGPWRAVAVQADGKIVVAGGGSGMDVARYLPDGAPDTAFGTDGRARLLPGTGTTAHALLLAADGTITVAGGRLGDIAVGRLTPAGQPVVAFGGAGTVVTDVGSDEAGYGVAELGGTFRVVGERGGFENGFVGGLVASYLPDGQPDTRFGPTGVTLTDSQGGYRLRAITPAGFMAVTYRGLATIASVGFSNGNLSWWTISVSNYLLPDAAGRAVRQADGRIVVMGTSGGVVGVARFNPSGTPDPSYGRSGRVVNDLIRNPRAIVIDAAGGAVVAGIYRGVAALVRFRPDGIVDTGWGVGGRWVLPASPYGSLPYALAALPDGKILLVGAGWGVGEPFIARLTAAGAPDPSFGTDGVRVGDHGAYEAAAMFVQPDGKVLLANGATKVMRLLADGSPDPSYGAGGTATVPGDAASVAGFQADGKVVLAGRSKVYRVTSNGTLDAAFAPPKLPWDYTPRFAAVIPLPDGRTIAVAQNTAVRLLGHGGLDPSFGKGGILTLNDDHTALTMAAFTTPDGALLAVGQTATAWMTTFSIVRSRIGAAGLVVPGAAGWNGYGQLGTGSTADRHAIAAVSGLTNAVALSAGSVHTLAVKADGTVWAWGWNGFGQLGDGTLVDRATPVTVAGLTRVVAVAAGMGHSLALKADGTVWAWGWNAVGQLGDGTTVDRRTPVAVIQLGSVTAIAAGALHSLALNGTVVAAWGWNGVGQLGDGTSMNRSTPVYSRVPAWPGPVHAIAAGAYHSMAISGYGTPYTWGWNGYGQLGDGTTADRYLPTPVNLGEMYLSLPRAIGAGTYHSLVVMEDGTVRAWGWNATGQLGDGTAIDRHAPVAVPGLSGVRGIAGGMYHSVAVGMDGVVRAWGWNGVGQLGTGGTADSRTPVVVPAPKAAGVVAAGAFHTVIS